MVLSSPPPINGLSHHNRQDSQTPSDDSSLYELSFAYTQDEDGNVVRVSRHRQDSRPSTPLVDVSSPTSPLIPIPKTKDDGGLKVPPRTSLSRSESAPYPIDSWEGSREWQRTKSTPASASSYSRPKSINALADLDIHNKENEHGTSLSSLQTPGDKYAISRKHAPLPLRVTRSNPPTTPGATSAPARTPASSMPPYMRVSSTPSLPLSRHATLPSELSLVGEAEDVALPESPPNPVQGQFGTVRQRGGSLSASNSLEGVRSRPSDSSAGDVSTPEDFDSYYSRPSTSSEAEVAVAAPLSIPSIPPRAGSRSRPPIPTITTTPASNLARQPIRARRVLLSEKKRLEIEQDYINDSEQQQSSLEPAAVIDTSPQGSQNAYPTPNPTSRQVQGFGHRRRESETIIPPTLLPPPIKTSPSHSIDLNSSVSRHKRSPTAPEAPTSSAHLGGSRDKLGGSSKTWGAAPVGEEEEEREVYSKEERRESGKSEGGGIANGVGPGFGPGTRQFVVNRKSYIRLDLIGRGGSSRVYRVLTPNNELYALKRISLDKTPDEEVAGYKNEISLLRRLEGNERIIRLIEAEVKGGPKGSLMLVMELGEIDLAHLLQRKQTVAVDMVWIRNIWKQMLEAVQVIHDEKIVHSDLKPANFVLVKGELKLIDFGIANAISNDTTNIQRDHQIGTVNYMSPEAIELPEGMRRLKVGRSSDIWSLACILYQMIYGQPPFAALSTLGKMKAIPDPSHNIEYAAESAPFLPASASDSPGNRPRDWAKKIVVPRIVIGILKTCLVRVPKERATIPELLEDSWLVDTNLRVLEPHQAAIDGHLMSQALQFAVRHGKDDPQWLRQQGEKLVQELLRLAEQQK